MTLIGRVAKCLKKCYIKWNDTPEFDPIRKDDQNRRPRSGAMYLTERL